MKFHAGVLILALWLAPVFVRPPAASAEDVSVSILPNGMKVIMREGHAINLAALDIWVKSGSVNETEADNGVSHFVEHMIFKATERYGPGEIDREIEGLGAELNGGTSKDWVHFYTTVASEHLPTALDALADAIMNAKFSGEDVEKERQVILDEIARAESNPSQRALSLFSRTAFVVHPYRLPPMGTRESVSGLSRDELIEYYKRHYRPENITVVIAGDVHAGEALNAVNKAFRGFTTSGGLEDAISAPPAEPAPATTRARRFRSLNGKTYVVLGYHAARAADLKEVCALDVMLALLGDTYHGRVSTSLSAKGIAFSSITTDFVTQRHPSTFAVLVSAEPSQTDKVISVLTGEFRRLVTEAVPNAELAQAKRAAEGGDLFDQETFAGQARALGLYDATASHDFALKYGAVVRSLTSSDILKAAQKYFGSRNCCVAIIEPELDP